MKALLSDYNLRDLPHKLNDIIYTPLLRAHAFDPLLLAFKAFSGAQYVFKIHYKPYDVIYDLIDLPHALSLANHSQQANQPTTTRVTAQLGTTA